MAVGDTVWMVVRRQSPFGGYPEPMSLHDSEETARERAERDFGDQDLVYWSVRPWKVLP